MPHTGAPDAVHQQAPPWRTPHTRTHSGTGNSVCALLSCRNDVHQQAICQAGMDAAVRPHVLSEEEAGWKVAIVYMHAGGYAKTIQEQDETNWPWMTTELAKLYCAK